MCSLAAQATACIGRALLLVLQAMGLTAFCQACSTLEQAMGTATMEARMEAVGTIATAPGPGLPGTQWWTWADQTTRHALHACHPACHPTP